MSALARPLPSRPRTYRFALTPLADAMFQLLIFFMLTSSLTPYSLVTLRGTTEDSAQAETDSAPAVQQSQDAEAPPPPNTQDTDGVTVWTLNNGTVTTNQQTFDISQLAGLAKAIGTQDNPGKIVILVTQEARVQDIATAIEAVNSAQVTAVQITRLRQ